MRAAASIGFVAIMGPVALTILHFRPDWFAWVVNIVFLVVWLETFYTTTLLGGLSDSRLNAANLLIIPLAALVIFGRTAALLWFAAFVVAVVGSAVMPTFVEPLHVSEASNIDSALTLITMGVVVMAISLNFVRQRDRYQKESDDLLHNILQKVATRSAIQPMRGSLGSSCSVRPDAARTQAQSSSRRSVGLPGTVLRANRSSMMSAVTVTASSVARRSSPRASVKSMPWTTASTTLLGMNSPIVISA